jgi:hypothetical protein
MHWRAVGPREPGRPQIAGTTARSAGSPCSDTGYPRRCPICCSLGWSRAIGCLLSSFPSFSLVLSLPLALPPPPSHLFSLSSCCFPPSFIAPILPLNPLFLDSSSITRGGYTHAFFCGMAARIVRWESCYCAFRNEVGWDNVRCQKSNGEASLGQHTKRKGGRERKRTSICLGEGDASVERRENILMTKPCGWEGGGGM